MSAISWGDFRLGEVGPPIKNRRERLESDTSGLRTPRLPRWTAFKRQIELAACKTLAFGLPGIVSHSSPQLCIWHDPATFRTHFNITEAAQANFAQPKRLGKPGELL